MLAARAVNHVQDLRHFLPAFRRYCGLQFHAVRAERPERWSEWLAYGLAQPVVAVKLLVAHRDLLKAALLPPLLLAAFCLFVAFTRLPHGPWRALKAFYLSFAALAPVPSILFARHYARLAARAHERFGFGACKPRIDPLPRSVRRFIHQSLMLSIAPVIAFIPLFILFEIAEVMFGSAAKQSSNLLYAAVTAIWALHWIIVDALDSAQTLRPDETLADADQRALAAPRPWFVRAVMRIHKSRFFRRVAGFLDRFSKFWREECELVEHHPVLAFGFGLSTAALLAIPGLNLFFRPITIVAAVHLAGAIESSSSTATHPPDLKAES